MSERKTPALMYHVDYICDVCNTGLMEFGGTTLTRFPPLHQHQCNRCGAVAALDSRYPRQEIKPQYPRPEIKPQW